MESSSAAKAEVQSPTSTPTPPDGHEKMASTEDVFQMELTPEGILAGTARKASRDEHDDEFDYVFTGGQREGETHKQVFKPKAAPAHLITNVRQQPLTSVGEMEERSEGEEEDEEVEEEEELGGEEEEVGGEEEEAEVEEAGGQQGADHDGFSSSTNMDLPAQPSLGLQHQPQPQAQPAVHTSINGIFSLSGLSSATPTPTPTPIGLLDRVKAIQDRTLPASTAIPPSAPHIPAPLLAMPTSQPAPAPLPPAPTAATSASTSTSPAPVTPAATTASPLGELLVEQISSGHMAALRASFPDVRADHSGSNSFPSDYSHDPAGAMLTEQRRLLGTQQLLEITSLPTTEATVRDTDCWIQRQTPDSSAASGPRVGERSSHESSQGRAGLSPSHLYVMERQPGDSGSDNEEITISQTVQDSVRGRTSYGGGHSKSQDASKGFPSTLLLHAMSREAVSVVASSSHAANSSISSGFAIGMDHPGSKGGFIPGALHMPDCPSPAARMVCAGSDSFTLGLPLGETTRTGEGAQVARSVAAEGISLGLLGLSGAQGGAAVLDGEQGAGQGSNADVGSLDLLARPSETTPQSLRLSPSAQQLLDSSKSDSAWPAGSAPGSIAGSALVAAAAGTAAVAAPAPGSTPTVVAPVPAAAKLAALAAVPWGAAAAAAAVPAAKPATPAQQPPQAQDEWEEANQRVEEATKGAAGTSVSPSTAVTRRHVAYPELLERMQRLSFTSEQQEAAKQLLPEQGKPTSFFARLFCLAPQPLSPELQAQLVHVLCCAKVAYSESEPLHWDLLTSSWAAFTGRSALPSRHGQHWAILGWQGDDPATDLRGCGVLGLLQLSSLHALHPSNAAVLYQLSRDTVQEYPLAIVSLNMTKYTLQALREGRLNSAVSEAGSVWPVLAAFHTGAMATFHTLWRDGKSTMVQSGFVMKDVEARCRQNVKAILKAATLV